MRRSSRLSSSGTKSRYFEDDVDESEDSLAPPNKKKQTPKRNMKAKQVDSSSDELQVDEVSEDEATEDEDDSEVVQVKKRGRGRPPKPQPKAKPNSKKRPAGNANDAETPRKKGRGRPPLKKEKPQSEDEEVLDDDSDDDESPRVEFIPLPQLRDTGGVEYEPEFVHPNTMAFLKDLKANNKRSWLKMRDPEYRRSLKDWEAFVETLTEKIIEADETIPELPLRDVIFRIYRDIRFSKDPTPYKPHYSAAWSRTGRKGPYACYYVHCEPGSCFVGGGLWHPDKDALAKLRANVDERPHRLRRILMNPEFRSAFLPKAKNDEASVISAFCESNKENALKIRPQGFNPEHRDIELLKLRNYTVGRKIKDSDLTSSDAQEKIMAIISPMVEYVTFLNNVVMPDPDFDSDSEGEGQGTELDGE
ncbi:hypothetical protein PFICI_10402 [Pestalotiopsis fici W106-1]|uniref:DUF2461 domain-containing protein n=1 Tax=Pestalotiopsis fici (strain W106-1 / CGMCC3.15140) TaxID=1229662 RepID=W3WWW6_PESFW|nr:uncharacterized protein PFICI_10402 [Pestalotiopsis fici W106-1]ETS78340.1 hypothetical protein PFICI_10402 [Pestalotiopsis fici W106-1]